MGVQPAQVADIGARRRWLTGLVVGLVFGVGVLIGGTVIGALAVVALVALVATPPRMAGVGGMCVGFGFGWLALFLTASERCGPECVMPDLRPWILAGAGLLVSGLFLSWRSR